MELSTVHDALTYARERKAAAKEPDKGIINFQYRADYKKMLEDLLARQSITSSEFFRACADRLLIDYGYVRE